MPSTAGVTPGEITFDANGVPHASAFGDVYHSVDGAEAQAQHVFLAGNGLPQRWGASSTFTIIETGFGLGINFLATWAALRTLRAHSPRLNYVSVDRHPPKRTDLERFYSRPTPLAPLARELIRAWPPLTRGFHRIDFDAGRLSLTLLLGDAAAMLAELDACADALFLDGFAPEKNPAMWSDAVFHELARLSRAGTTAATWTVAASVRTRLSNAGFRTEKRPGFGRKREMLIAEKIGERHAREPHPPPPGTRAVVVGAGLAGVWCAHALARRGWQVDLIERNDRAAQLASGNAVGAVRPALNLADNDNAQIARAAFLFSARNLAADPALARFWSPTGVLHVAIAASQVERMQRIIADHRFPPEYVSWLDTQQASRLAQHRIAAPGWWIPLGGWAQPPGLCEALLQLNRERIVCHFGREAVQLANTHGIWRVVDGQGATIASAPTLILAGAHEIGRFATIASPPLVRVRGQVTHLPAHHSHSLGIVVCGDGYVAPLPGGGHCVGATFGPDDTDTSVRLPDHVENLARLERMLPGFGSGLNAATLGGRAALRTATADRLPACGEIAANDGRGSETPGLYAVAGLGARGLIWAPLCAEVLASRLNNEPNPLERRLMRALDPQRLFARASMRSA